MLLMQMLDLTLDNDLYCIYTVRELDLPDKI